MEIEVLLKGLSFCPQTNFNKFEIIKDINIFARNLLPRVLHDKGTEILADELAWKDY